MDDRVARRRALESDDEIAARLVRWNALAAERLEGWRWMSASVRGEGRQLVPPDADLGDGWVPAASTGAEDQNPVYPVPDYAHDLNAAARLEAVIYARGLAFEYADHLSGSVVGTTFLDSQQERWEFVIADAEERLESALTVSKVVPWDWRWQMLTGGPTA